MPVQRGYIPGPMGSPQMGPQGGIQGFGPTGAQGFQQPLASQLVEGVSKFVANYRDAQEKEKAAALQRAMQGIELMQKGLPVDQKKIAKDFKKADVAFDYEGPTPLEQFEQQQAQFQQQQQAAMAGMMAPQPAMNRAMGGPGPMPGPQAAPPMPGMLPQAPSPQAIQADQQARNPGFWGQAGRSMFGDNRPIPENAGVFDALRQIQQQGQAGIANEEQAAKIKTQTLEILKKAMGGNAKAQEMARNLGLFEKLGPREELLAIGEKAGIPREQAAAMVIREAMGGPEMDRQINLIAANNADRFGGSTEKAFQYYTDVFSGKKPTIEPSMSLDEKVELRQRTADIIGQYPSMPYNIASFLAELQPGTEQYAEAFSAVSRFYKPKGVEDAERFAKGQQMDMARLQQSWTIHAQQLELASLQAARQAVGQQFDDLFKIVSSDADQETKNAATLQLAEVMNQPPYNAGVTVKRLRSWAGLVDSGQYAIIPKVMPDVEMGPYVGAGPDAASGMGKTLEAFKAWAKRMNEKNGTEIGPNDFFTYMGTYAGQ